MRPLQQAVADQRHDREAGDQRAIEVEEGPDLGPRGPSVDLPRDVVVRRARTAEHSVAHAPRPADGLPRRPALGVVSGRGMTTRDAARAARGDRPPAGRLPARRLQPHSSAASCERWIEEHHVPTGIAVRRDPDPAVAPPPAHDGSTRASRPRSPPTTIRCSRRCASPGCPARRTAARGGAASDLLLLGDPRDPGRCARLVGCAGSRTRCRVVAGEPAPLSELRERWRRAGGADVGADRPASPSSSRARRRSRSSAPSAACAARATRCRASCTRTSSARPAFRGGIARLARELGQPRGDGRARGGALPAEIAATTARTSSTSPRTSSTCSTRAATARRCTTTAAQLERHLRARRSATRWSSCRRTSRTSTTSCCSTRCTRTAIRRTTPPAAST